MSGPQPRRTVPLRAWLVAVLLLIVLVPVAAVVLVNGVAESSRASDGRQAEVRALVASAPGWSDSAWRRRADAWFSGRGMHVLVLDAREQVVYASPGTDPAARETGNLLPVTDAAGEPGMAFVLASAAQPPLLVWGPGLAGLLAALLLVGWLVSRAIIRPLAGLTRAAGQVAAGDLDLSLPSTPVGEIDQVAAAFSTMGDELRRSIQRQSELEEDRRLFIGMVAHDLRTPLFALRGYLEGLETGVARSPEMASRYVRKCIDRAAVLERRIGDLFAYTRLEYLEQPPRRERVDLGTVLARAVEDAQPAARARAVAMLLAAPARPCVVHADPHMISRVVENLLDNAVRHTPEAGSVRLAWWPVDGGGGVVKVADSGPGVDPARLPWGDGGARPPGGHGAGLGLTIARRILRAHGGDLSARNLPEGGAEFTASIGPP